MFGDILPPLIDMAAAGALFYAAWRVKSSGGPLARKLALAWLVLGIAEACTGIADTLWMVFDLVLHTQPSPSAADVFYLLYYGFFLAGVLLLPAVKKEGFDWLKTFLDILILLLSAFLFALTFIIGPVLASGAPDTLTLAVGLAYPTGDMMLIGALLMILYRPARSVAGLTVLLLAASVAVMIIFDLIYLYLSIEGLYQAGAWIDLGYSLSNLLMGLAGVSQVWWMGQARVMSQARFTSQARFSEPGSPRAGTGPPAGPRYKPGRKLAALHPLRGGGGGLYHAGRPPGQQRGPQRWVDPGHSGIDDRAGAAAPDAGAAGEPGAFQNAQERAG